MLRAFDLGDSTPLWSLRTTGPVNDLLATDRGFLLAAHDTLLLIAPETGEVIYATELPAPATALIAATETTAYVGIATGIVAVDLERGDLRWATERSASPPTGELALYDGAIYSVEEAGAVSALRDSDGELLFRVSLPGEAGAGPLVGREHVVAVADRTAVLLSPRNGALSGSFESGRLMIHGAAGAENLLILGSADGTLTARSIPAGAVRWNVSLGSDLAQAPIVTANVVIAAGFDGMLVSYDLRDGSIRSTLRLPDTPVTPSVWYGESLWFGLANGTLVALGLGESVDEPLFDSQSIWTLPDSGTFRLQERSVTLQIGSVIDAVVEWRVSSRPDEELMLSVLTQEGDVLATNMGAVALSDTVRVTLAAGEVYLFRIERANADGEAQFSVIQRVAE